ncbi:hypothetical protein Q5P01_003650 [Channa striata]|uniref:LRRNT domain-containing protein n=1 Tax=Channa striata TaxID=64152 RepID=A0AA88NMD2_CHASR|nr:hypothetical protein Q5P01_003650 [Channa striata]
MRMLVRLFLGLFVLKVVVASPRFSRQVDLDTYDSTNYDVDMEKLNSENQENYDYEDELTIDDPQIEIGTLAPPYYNYPVPEASLEEQEEEDNEQVEEFQKPQFIPQGSGGSGVLMGPETQKEVELRLAPFEIPHVFRNYVGYVGPEALAVSGASGSGGSGDLLVSGASGSSGDIAQFSGNSGDLSGSGGSGGIFIVSGTSGDLLSSGGSGDIVPTYGASEELSGSGGSGDIFIISGTSGDLLITGGSGDIVPTSGAFEELLGSGSSGELLVSGDLWVSGDLSGSGDTMGSTTSGASGDLSSGGSGISIELPLSSGGSGDQSGSGFSGDPLVSGASGSSGVSGESGESGDTVTLLPGEEELPLTSSTLPSEASGVSEEFSGTSGISGASGETSVDISGASGTSGASGSGEFEVPEVTLVPDTDEEKGLLLTTPETPQERTGTVEGSVSSELPEPAEPDEPDEPVIPAEGMPTCVLCVCLGGSVYCDDLRLDSIPPLPKATTHFYARYNRITKINKSDFASMNKLKRIDLTGNEIRVIDDKAFLGLPELEELVIRQNHISQLPALPDTMTLIDASHNDIGTRGIHKEAFKDMSSLQYLHLMDNHLDYIPVPLPDSLRSLHLQRNNIQMMHEDTFCNLKDFNYIRNALEDIRLDGNPINLSKTPQAYICLPRIPIGDLI